MVESSSTQIMYMGYAVKNNSTKEIHDEGQPDS
jgi:hypothetical protein